MFLDLIGSGRFPWFHTHTKHPESVTYDDPLEPLIPQFFSLHRTLWEEGEKKQDFSKMIWYSHLILLIHIYNFTHKQGL